MSATAFSGPVVTYKEDALVGLSTPPVGIPGNQNPDAGSPSMFLHGMALLDPRPQYTYFVGDSQNPLGFTSAGVAINTAPVLGWLNARFQVADYAPGTASTTSLATGCTLASSTAVALTTSNGSGVTTASTCTNASTGATVTGLWLIDNVPSYVSYGSGTFGCWDPANPAMARCLSITAQTGTTLSSTTFTIAGYDTYGYPITQAVSGPASGATVYTSKAFKWVTSVTGSGTVAISTFSLGVSDIYGLPLAASSVGYIEAYFDNKMSAVTTSAVTFTAASAYTATTSSDVRGTINLSGVTTSNGARKLQMWISVSPSSLTTSGLFGAFPPA